MGVSIKVYNNSDRTLVDDLLMKCCAILVTCMEATMSYDRWNLNQEKSRFGMESFLAFTKVDGLDSYGARILGKGSLQSFETVGLVPVGIYHLEK